MKILLTNDDGYRAKGIQVLTEIMRQFGDVMVVAPKFHQSGMSMAVSMTFNAVQYKQVLEEPAVRNADGNLVKGALTVSYVNATPTGCVKFALNILCPDNYPDVLISGINHGSNAASAACYSGTLGAAAEGAINGVPAIGVSLDSTNLDADFSAVEKLFPDIFRKIMANLPTRPWIYYNINFPNIPVDQIRGIRTGYQGKTHWIKEFMPWKPELYIKHGIPVKELGTELNPTREEGEELYMLTGTFVDDPGNDACADHQALRDGYISFVAHTLDSTDYTELDRLRTLNIDAEFQH
ncbi:MAG: 5'/3'-nucleotidase SurE [Bacteroidales bacterium]|nr:5'/3'-nucleotidase SurE [Bacteroidales bacterium]